METENSAGSSYHCPHCRALLVLGRERWQGWVRCPECGRPGLPPERLAAHAAPKRRAEPRSPINRQDATSLEEPGAMTTPSKVLSPPLAPRSSPSSASRVIVSTGLIVSIFLLLVAYLDRSSQSSAIFGFLTVIFFLLLLRLPKRR